MGNRMNRTRCSRLFAGGGPFARSLAFALGALALSCAQAAARPATQTTAARPAAQTTAARPATQTTAAGYTDAQFKSVTAPEEAQVAQVRDQEIAQIKIVLGRRFEESRRPEILLRLAELYVERYRFYFLKENEIYQKTLKAGAKPSRVDHTASREQLRQANEACRSILKSEVPFAKMDQVFYFLGYNAQEMGDDGEAVNNYETVVMRYPQSGFAAESFRNLAEYAYQKRDYRRAASYYEKAARFTSIASYPRTLYKLAWSYFRVRRRVEALETMKKAVRLSAGDEKFIALHEEALNDLVFFYADSGKFTDARGYFSGIKGGTDFYVKALGRLAKVYERDGKYREALAINSGLFSEHGASNPALAFQILQNDVELRAKLGDAKGEEAALNALVKYFSEHSEDIASGEDAQTAYAQAKGYVRARVTETHKEARKKKDKTLFSRSAGLYAMYLRAFLSKPHDAKERQERSQIRIYLTDALLAAGREDDALPELEAALADESGDPKLRREAGATLLDILIKRIDSARGSSLRRGSRVEGSEAESTARHAVQTAEKRFQEDADRFEEAFPKDPLVPELRFKRARLAAAHSGSEGLSKDARNALNDFIEKFPERPEAAEAARDLVADQLKRKQGDDAVELAGGFLKNQKLLAADKRGELKRYLNAVVSRQSFEDVKSIEKGEDYLRAAEEYERLAASAQDKEVAFKSLNNAAVNYERAGKIDEAFRVYSKMFAANPKNAALKENLKHLALGRLAASEFVPAAALYAKLSADPRFTATEQLAFLRTAVALYWGMGDFVAAAAAGEKALKGGCAAKADPSCHELALDTARIHVEAGKSQDALRVLKDYLAKRRLGLRNAEANYMIGVLYEAMHEPGKARTYFEQAASHAAGAAAKGIAARERGFAAHAAINLVEPEFRRFEALKIELPEAKLKAVTRQKLAMVERLVGRYQRVLSYGDGEWGIAALSRLARIFAGFASEIEHAPVPPNIASNPALKEKYRAQLKNVYAPMLQKADEYLRQGYKKGLQLSVTSPVFTELSRDLSARAPTEFPPAEFPLDPLPAGLIGAVKDDDAKALRKSGHEWRMSVTARLSKNPKDADAWVELANIEVISGRDRIAELCYEQALALSPKNAAALNNVSLIRIRAKEYLLAGQGFARAAGVAEFSKDVNLNLANYQMSFRQFPLAQALVDPLLKRFPEDRAIQISAAAAFLGTGKYAQAKGILDRLEAKDSKRFALWYNWSVWALLQGSKDEKEDALDMLKNRRGELGEDERKAVDVALAVGGAK
ncbi:MAG: tetratricopeptide repeat protein [Deltaproteobacteria bacterium]|nr:tetratricopeptide repeat protein [Deltaproteobacteria bacterium]